MIDLETMSAYNGSTNMNDKVSIEDGTVLASGDNNISVSSGITSVTITPRWWTI
jgi:phage-related protein